MDRFCAVVLAAPVGVAVVMLSTLGYSRPLRFMLGVAGIIALVAALSLLASQLVRRPAESEEARALGIALSRGRQAIAASTLTDMVERCSAQLRW